MTSEVEVPEPPNEKRGGKGRTLHVAGETIKGAEGGQIAHVDTINATTSVPLRPPLRKARRVNPRAEAQALAGGLKVDTTGLLAREARKASHNPEQIRAAVRKNPSAFTLLNVDGIGG